MSFQRRLQRIMKKRGWRVADLARALGVPYTTVREWVVYGRLPSITGDLSLRMEELER